MSDFSGFSTDAMDFLRDLAAHNDRAWFQPRKADYERLLKRPFEDLCAAVGEEFAARDVPLQSDPIRSPFRIYRDIRFSKDKSPYKTWLAASFEWIGGGSGSAGCYFHLQPENVYVGGGRWHPDSAWVGRWRTFVDERSDELRSLLDDPGFASRFGDLHGDGLKRVPPGYPADHPEAELLKLKDVTFGIRLDDAAALSPELPATIATTLGAAVPVMRLLAAI
jgi:uncharacterized protein (TIGR02453 family)